MLKRALILVLLATALAGPGAVGAEGAVDAHAEIAAALFAASATQAAVEKAADARISAQQAQIAQLAAKVKAGQAKQAELTQAQEGFVAQLAAKDRAYAAAIDSFRGAVTHITETPEGAAALAKFNAGDEIGALAIIHQLNDARDAALQKATDIQKAVGRRDEAQLALEARNRGKLDTATVIALFQDVVKLDPGVQADWLSLSSLYNDTAHHEDGYQAALTAGKLASTDAQRATADIAIGDALYFQDKYAAAIEPYREATKIRVALVQANPNDEGLRHDGEQALDRMGRLFIAAGQYDMAQKAYEANLVSARWIAAHDPAAARPQRDVAVVLSQLGDIAVDNKDLPGALKDYQESLDIVRKLAIADPTNLPLQRDLVSDLVHDGAVRQAQGDAAGARPLYVEALASTRRLAAADPGNANLQHLLGMALVEVAQITEGGVSWTDVVAQYEAMDRTGQLTDQERSVLEQARAKAAASAPAARP